MNLACLRVEAVLGRLALTHVRLCIWGAGQLGDSIINYLQSSNLNCEVVGVTDSSIRDSFNKEGLRYLPLDCLIQLDPDVIIIASIAYQDEIAAQINERFPQFNERLLLLTEPSYLSSIIEKAILDNDLSQLTQLAFEYPDCAEVWRALAQLTKGEDAKSYHLCADLLS